MELETLSAIRRELQLLEVELNRLEHYVSLLAKPKVDVIKLLYFERKSWDEIAAELSLSKQTLSRYRKSAITELASMFSFLHGVKSSEDTEA